MIMRGPEHQTYRFCLTDTVAPAAHDEDTPIQLAHTVLNVNDLQACEAFAL